MTDEIDIAAETTQRGETVAIAQEIGTVEERTLVVLRNIMISMRAIEKEVARMHTRIDVMEEQAADFSPDKLSDMMKGFGG